MREKESKNKEEFLAKYNELKGEIHGHAVIYPCLFLSDENLGQNFLNSEVLVPEITFV